ncbi:MAG: hypothetical protein IJH20_01350 [Bacilli bacterium]|nr:hypothetical protein [Bacilli bacterium]
MDRVDKLILAESERARKEIQENDNKRANSFDDLEVLDADLASRETPDFIEAREKQIENSSKEIDRDYAMSKEEADIDRSDEITKQLEEGIEKYLDDTPSFATKMAKKFMHLVQKEENLEIKKRKPIYKSFTPYVVLATMALSSIFTSIIKEREFERETVSFSSNVEDIFESVDKAPIPVMDAYVSATTTGYYEGSSKDKELRNEKFEEAYRRFYSELAKENPDLDVLKESARAVSNIAAHDKLEETTPFENTVFKGSIVKDGEVFVPVVDESQIKDGEELTSQNGTLYRKGR